MHVRASHHVSIESSCSTFSVVKWTTLYVVWTSKFIFWEFRDMVDTVEEVQRPVEHFTLFVVLWKTCMCTMHSTQCTQPAPSYTRAVIHNRLSYILAANLVRSHGQPSLRMSNEYLAMGDIRIVWQLCLPCLPNTTWQLWSLLSACSTARFYFTNHLFWW